MRVSLAHLHLTGISLLFSLGLSSCTAEQNVTPTMTGCNELVTVRLCASYGDAPNCAARHTTLQLANRYHVLPVGAVWQRYQSQQVNRQVLRVGYELGPELPPNVDGLRTANITCLEVSNKEQAGE
ncbi:hypothetical protein [Hymenobacter mucosus]|uniref:Lipoprotein n=1 Tax=Hymenobacter mucosus TaxID=1411120 RepID=A0A239AGU2_9BACT|nr:hypothetical protein [Hymenobacter mucosus]SNR94582.1 hypothetical protein SAMN06269173_11264 [Hymenobacter mucosus]